MDYKKRCEFLEQRIKRLNAIGLALSTEEDTNKIFEMILEEARHITNADGRTLYMIDKENNLRYLTPEKLYLDKDNWASLAVADLSFISLKISSAFLLLPFTSG